MRFSAGMTVAVAALLVLSGCAGTRVSGPVSTLSPSPTPTATLAPTSSPKPTAEPSVTSAPPNQTPRELAVLACQTWQASLSQAPSEYLATQDKAKQHAREAAAGDSRWQPIAEDMTILVALGNDSSPAAVAKGQATFTDLGNQCRVVGVVVSAG